MPILANNYDMQGLGGIEDIGTYGSAVLQVLPEWFREESFIGGVPNWVLAIAGGVVGLLILTR